MGWWEALAVVIVLVAAVIGCVWAEYDRVVYDRSRRKGIEDS
jgi:hypothetical protein